MTITTHYFKDALKDKTKANQLEYYIELYPPESKYKTIRNNTYKR